MHLAATQVYAGSNPVRVFREREAARRRERLLTVQDPNGSGVRVLRVPYGIMGL